MAKLYVGGLPFAYSDQDLKDLFAEFGEVVSATIIVDKFSNRSKGFGFVEFGSDDEANAAIEKLNGSDAGGRKILVDHARPPKERTDFRPRD
jgi:RNA recognition motif-containing protein